MKKAEKMSRGAKTKEKRYFCDFFFEEIPSRKNLFLGLILSFLIPLIVGIIFSYNIFLTKYDNELTSYSENVYAYLDEIADKVIKEGVGIDVVALPDEVAKYEIIGENGTTTFNYYLDNNNGMEYAVSANMTIKLADNFTIISKKPNYSSEKEYVRDIKSAILLKSISDVAIGWTCIYMSIFGVCMIVATISVVNKRKNIWLETDKK